MSAERRVFVQIDPAVAAKEFAARRAGLADADDAADERFVALLRVLSPARPREPWHLRTTRPLSDAEKRQYLAGQLLALEIVREDLWSARVAEKTAMDRAQRGRRAARAASEARRLAAEAARFDAP